MIISSPRFFFSHYFHFDSHPPGSIEENLKGPLLDALHEYKDGPNLDDKQEAYKSVWNEVQKEVSLIRP